MEKFLSTLILTSTLALALNACEEQRTALDNPPGKYERTTSSTDAQGTTVEKKTSTEVEVDEYGNKKAVVESKTTKDPKGLFNKKTTSKTKIVEEDRDY